MENKIRCALTHRLVMHWYNSIGARVFTHSQSVPNHSFLPGEFLPNLDIPVSAQDILLHAGQVLHGASESFTLAATAPYLKHHCS